MFIAIILILMGTIYMGLLGTYVYLFCIESKVSGPLPWEYNYDNARINRVEREKRNKIGEHKVEIELDDYV